MKPTKKIRWLMGGVVGMFLLSMTVPSRAEEIRFLKVKYMSAQRETGLAIVESSQGAWRLGQTEERLGKMIRDAGPAGKIDQKMLGEGIAEAASLKWRLGLSKESLGSAIAQTATVAYREAAITGPAARQERLGRAIQAEARYDWTLAMGARRTALIKAGERQERMGREIQKAAQARWAEAGIGQAVQSALSSGRVSGPISPTALSIVGENVGYRFEANLRLALSLLSNQTGKPLTQMLPAPTIISSAGPPVYTELGWGGFAEYGLASLVGFVWAMAMFSWTLTDLDRARVEEVKEAEEAAPLRRAA